jgi:hypothetical protein
MRTLVTLLTYSLMVGGTFAQFGKDRLAAIEAAEGLGGARPAGDVEQEAEETRQLAETYSLQRGRDIDVALSEIFRMAASSSRGTDPLGAPMGVPLKEPIGADVDGGVEDGGAQGPEKGAVTDGFSSAVKGIDIRGINPGRSEFLSGSDNIFEGDVVDISGSGGVFRVWIVEVGEDGVVVMDDRSKQTEKIPLSIGGQGIAPRGWGASGTVEEAPPF